MFNGFNLKEINGDLFSASDEYALGHCVAADLRMGAGIAVKFRYFKFVFLYLRFS